MGLRGFGGVWGGGGKGPGMGRIGVLMVFDGFPRGTHGKWGVR